MILNHIANSSQQIAASYEYSRLGKRLKKTVGDTDTYFVYDQFGNIISEYQSTGSATPAWQRNYAYGATGEPIYMHLPRTAIMDVSLANLYDFADAWLCEPNCTPEQLIWDYDGDYQVNFIDLAAFHSLMDLAFADNGRMLLADAKGSVIGKIDYDGDLTEIEYNAWGSPAVSTGSDLEGLSNLWNGYYYDDETGNYYLRNRYYSPVERRFLTEDPHGINPDGNWRNRFNPLIQYADGAGLGVYTRHDPVNKTDRWGLMPGLTIPALSDPMWNGPRPTQPRTPYYGWTYAKSPADRSKEATTFLYASSVSRWKYDIKGLAKTVRLNEEEFNSWGRRTVETVGGVKRCGARVANTAYIHVGNIDSVLFGWHFSESNRYFVKRSQELKELYQRYGYKTILRKQVNNMSNINTDLNSIEVIAWGFLGHGNDGALSLYPNNTNSYYSDYAMNSVHHKLAEVYLYSCNAAIVTDSYKTAGYSWMKIISKYGHVHMSEESFVISTTNLNELPVHTISK